MKLNNNYFLLRHGEALSNKKNIVSCWPEKFYNPLTTEGKKRIKLAAKNLKNEKIDMIFASDVLRTKMTAEIIGKKIKVRPRFDKRLREFNVGVYNGVPISSYWDKYESYKNRFRIHPEKGESYYELSGRIFDFLREINKKYKEKNILIVSHQLPIYFFIEKMENLSRKKLLKEYILNETSIPTGTLVKFKTKK